MRIGQAAVACIGWDDNRVSNADGVWVRSGPDRPKRQSLAVFSLTMVTPTGIEPVLQP